MRRSAGTPKGVGAVGPPLWIRGAHDVSTSAGVSQARYCRAELGGSIFHQQIIYRWTDSESARLCQDCDPVGRSWFLCIDFSKRVAVFEYIGEILQSMTVPWPAHPV